MTNLELLHDLNRRHARLEIRLSNLKDELFLLNMRLDRTDSTAGQPSPIAMFAPLVQEQTGLSPLPDILETPMPLSETAPEPEPRSAPVDGAGLELQFGRWLARIGVVFALFTLIFFSVLVHDTLYKHLGPWGKLTALALVSGSLIGAGLRLEKRDSTMLVYGRTLAGGGMACLYYTLYGAIYVPQLQVISSPLLGGFFLLAWSAAVLVLAERRKSELLSIFAISLGYFSTAITPGHGFSMTADLILAATAVIFQLRNAWTGLSYLCLLGTYAGFVRETVMYRGPFAFDWVGGLDFWPSAVYLTGAWLNFTAAILLSRTSHFTAGKRMTFLCLNNGAWAGLMVVAAQFGAFGHLGGTLGFTGGAMLAACGLARFLRSSETDIADAYLAQGLGLATGGIAVAYAGATRGLMLTIESVFLVTSGAFSRKLILRIGGGVTAVLGTYYFLGEIFPHDGTWILALVGTVAMLANAWLARRESWSQPRDVARMRWAWASAGYTALGLVVMATGICCNAGPKWLGPDLAGAALFFTLAIYVFPLFELPPLAQGLLIVGQLLAFGLPLLDSGTGPGGYHIFAIDQATWSPQIVALVTMLLATWWSRQKTICTGWWMQPLMVIYAVAMVVFSYDTFHAHAMAQSWMIYAALLSLIFLAYGAWSRLWAFAVSGQILLGLSVYTCIWNNGDFGFPWTWWAAATPIAVVFGTGWIAREVLPRYVQPENKDMLRTIGRIYQSVAQGLLIRWVFGVAPYPEITFLLVALGTAFVEGGLVLRSSYGVRSGFVLSAVGVVHYFTNTGPWNNAFTWLDAGAFALLLAQPALVRRWGRELISDEESWVLILASSAAGWLFVSNAVNATDPHNLTLGWAIFALALTVTGLAANERRQRWCGLGVLVAAFIRVAVHDFWAYSDLMKVLTFLALTVICLGLSFLYFKFEDRLREWL